MVAVTLLLRRRKMKWLPMADVVAPYLILGYAVGRVGCFLVGDDYGMPSNLPWAMAFPNGLPPTTVAVHPTQLYEIALGLSIFGILYRLRSRAKFAGQVLALYLLLVGAERFFIEFIRTNRQYAFGFTGAQYIGAALVIAGGYLLYRLPRAKEAAPS